MSESNHNDLTDELGEDMPEEYDFSKMDWKPNPYYRRVPDTENAIRHLAPDLSRFFPDDLSVDRALRMVVQHGMRTNTIFPEAVADAQNEAKKDQGREQTRHVA